MRQLKKKKKPLKRVPALPASENDDPAEEESQSIRCKDPHQGQHFDSTREGEDYTREEEDCLLPSPSLLPLLLQCSPILMRPRTPPAKQPSGPLWTMASPQPTIRSDFRMLSWKIWHCGYMKILASMIKPKSITQKGRGTAHFKKEPRHWIFHSRATS